MCAHKNLAHRHRIIRSVVPSKNLVPNRLSCGKDAAGLCNSENIVINSGINISQMFRAKYIAYLQLAADWL